MSFKRTLLLVARLNPTSGSGPRMAGYDRHSKSGGVGENSVVLLQAHNANARKIFVFENYVGIRETSQ